MGKSNRLYAWETALLLALSLTMLTGVFAQSRQTALSGKVIRLHVIAESDSEADQAVKLEVRDAVLERLAPELAGVSDPTVAAGKIAAVLPELEKIARTVSGGEAHAMLSREPYPTREYEDFALPAGMYSSLRIVLGEGEGHNWWCVVYPPLCTASVSEAVETGALAEKDVKLITEDGTGYVIRFRLIEWWENILGKM